ncbi:hypothetical protein AX774_g1854 [Zancudomyces culisetae]|uniref:Uncharacterized protein n=1 Tax=Zancudomyces culisetae TaxID=1213189 RepID=A0A1R1PUE6_ZANCU|nr:hypothetical protein AX774_g2007 [Zancudomyces culisetae]OMH84605.1 hypothetical protein AX774_g1854 [Zancudomyces culisetae]|eukprot:OMH84487.1 hypothetical protein AX774_g2007 [Zancudomyces culisetae]
MRAVGNIATATKNRALSLIPKRKTTNEQPVEINGAKNDSQISTDNSRQGRYKSTIHQNRATLQKHNHNDEEVFTIGNGSETSQTQSQSTSKSEKSSKSTKNNEGLKNYPDHVLYPDKYTLQDNEKSTRNNATMNKMDPKTFYNKQHALEKRGESIYSDNTAEINMRVRKRRTKREPYPTSDMLEIADFRPSRAKKKVNSRVLREEIGHDFYNRNENGMTQYLSNVETINESSIYKQDFKRIESVSSSLSIFKSHLSDHLLDPQFYAPPVYTRDRSKLFISSDPDTTPLYGYALLAFTVFTMVTFLYALFFSKMLPDTGNVVSR